MPWETQKNLKPYNTFGIASKAARFISVSTTEGLKKAIKEATKPLMLLGGGSNVLFTKDFKGSIIHLNIKGKQILETHDNYVIAEFAAGENWHDTVMYCLKNQWGGIENLALIPGQVGTAPIQNIGAYGVELKDIFVSCKAINLKTGATKTFLKEACEFGYRESIFKTSEKHNYCITHVSLKLTTKNHLLNTSYGSIQDLLQAKGYHTPTPMQIAEVVMEIRQTKLPDPKKIGNAGSFFKNPVVNKNTLENLQTQYPNMPFYKLSNTTVKIPAAWLIQTAGYKGYRQGDVGVHNKQALVLVNYGQASGAKIKMLALEIKEAILDKFGITLEPEVTFI